MFAIDESSIGLSCTNNPRVDTIYDGGVLEAGKPLWREAVE